MRLLIQMQKFQMKFQLSFKKDTAAAPDMEEAQEIEIEKE